MPSAPISSTIWSQRRCPLAVSPSALRASSISVPRPLSLVAFAVAVVAVAVAFE